jgi:hypothetical protein
MANVGGRGGRFIGHSFNDILGAKLKDRRGAAFRYYPAKRVPVQGS